MTAWRPGIKATLLHLGYEGFLSRSQHFTSSPKEDVRSHGGGQHVTLRVELVQLEKKTAIDIAPRRVAPTPCSI